MKDFEPVAYGAIMGDTENMQHKKPFEIADVDNNAMKLEVILKLRQIKTKRNYAFCTSFAVYHALIF